MPREKVAKEKLVPLPASRDSQARVQYGAVLFGETQPQFIDRVTHWFFNEDPVRVAHIQELMSAIINARPPLVGPDATREEVVRALNLPESDGQLV